MNDWLRVIGCALISALLGVLLKELGFAGSRMILLLGTVGAIGFAAVCVGEVMEGIVGLSPENAEYVRVILKMVGISYVAGVCSDICTDLGQTSLSGAISSVGRVEIMILSLPYVKRIIEEGVKLL